MIKEDKTKTNKVKVYFNKEKQKVPIKSWASDLEGVALDQAKNLADLPFIFKHVALMPDAHMGYGMPIGGVIATKDVVIPHAVGSDIGCGMCTVQTNLKAEDVAPKIREVMSLIRKAIPVGFNRHKTPRKESLMPEWKPSFPEYADGIVRKEYSSALTQLGTLGGGNHFIEIQKDEKDNVFIMIHSGSRNLGKKVCDHYNALAKEMNIKWNSVSKKDLAFLTTDSKEAIHYLSEMQFCVDFALANRREMIQQAAKCFNEVFGDVEYGRMINIAHNYAKKETHFGEEVIIHRKGATSAVKGELGIIPGSQGAHSYIVRGLGNPESFHSCSHGAGRKMGRNVAKNTLDLTEETAKLDAMGVVHSVRGKKELDEAPGAYKDIEVVMANQSDLIEIVAKLTPMGVIKG